MKVNWKEVRRGVKVGSKWVIALTLALGISYPEFFVPSDADASHKLMATR